MHCKLSIQFSYLAALAIISLSVYTDLTVVKTSQYQYEACLWCSDGLSSAVSSMSPLCSWASFFGSLEVPETPWQLLWFSVCISGLQGLLAESSAVHLLKCMLMLSAAVSFLLACTDARKETTI